MHIFFIRHCEAAKNLDASFAGDDLRDGLTAKGQEDAQKLIDAIRSVEQRCGLHFERVVSSKSPRAKQTAAALSHALARDLIIQAGLESIGSGVLSGRSEDEAWQRHPDYMRALTLYRAGVFNSYAIPRFEGKEDKATFEARVWDAFRSGVSGCTRDAIVVAGRSTITALLIRVARLANHYSDGFFGHIPLDLAGVSWVIVGDKSAEIVNVNVKAGDLATGDLSDMTLGRIN